MSGINPVWDESWQVGGSMAGDPESARGGAPIFQVHFKVEGEPIPQGSMKIMPITRIPETGLWIRSVRELLSKVTMTADNPKLKQWRKEVAAQAQGAMEEYGLALLDEGPIKVTVQFTFPFLKSHFKSDGVTLRNDRSIWKATQPDTDKLVRALGDSMSKVVFKDDGQVSWWDVRKQYGSTPGVSVYVYTL